MRVLCIKSSSNTEKTVSVKKGKIYNVTDVKQLKDNYLKDYGTDVWYELLETGPSALHIGALFVLAPAEKEITTITNSVLEKIRCN